MNDQVETIYTQMFAPQPIPQSVRELYDRTLFLANRIDCQLTVGALVLIAAMGTQSATVPETEPTQPAAVAVSDTDAAPQTPPEQTSAPGAMVGPLGLMDAPQGETTESGANSLAASLNRMTKAELVAHATDACGMEKKQVLGRTKKGKCTKTDYNLASRGKIIERILGQKNG